MRGGTSKGAYFLQRDLPADEAERDRVLLAVMGSPDPRQIDGIGGADPLTSKVAIVSKLGAARHRRRLPLLSGVRRSGAGLDGRTAAISSRASRPSRSSTASSPAHDPETEVRIFWSTPARAWWPPCRRREGGRSTTATPRSTAYRQRGANRSQLLRRRRFDCGRCCRPAAPWT